MTNNQSKQLQEIKAQVNEYYNIQRVISNLYIRDMTLWEQYGAENQAVNCERKLLQREIEMLTDKVKPVDAFLMRLNTYERLMFYNLYKSKEADEAYERYQRELGLTRKQLEAQIVVSIIRNWNIQK